MIVVCEQRLWHVPVNAERNLNTFNKAVKVFFTANVLKSLRLLKVKTEGQKI